MSTFTSSLPDDLLNKLAQKSRELSLPKNKILEKALSIYIDQLEKQDYIRSYNAASDDDNILQMAEEGMIDYLTQLEETDDSH